MADHLTVYIQTKKYILQSDDAIFHCDPGNSVPDVPKILYVERCIVCCRHLPKKCFHRGPLKPRVAWAPWSHVMIDFVGPLVKN